MSEKNLKSHQVYVDQYDRFTVERCRRIEKQWDEDDPEPSEDDKVTKEQAVAIKKMAKELRLYFETGERYINKDKTILDWESSDRKRDELYESSQPPEDIRCLTCRNRVKVTFKELWTELDKPDRVLFMFDCPNQCLPRRTFFNDGEEWRIKPNLCPSCNVPLAHSESDDSKKITTTYTCPKCTYSKTDEYTRFVKQEEDIDLNFATDRDRFCLTDEAGKKYQNEKWNLEQLGKLMEEIKAKEIAREEKLKLNPGGFLLEDGYSCCICNYGDHESRDRWYDEWGIKCLICQKAIENGEIPASVAKDKESWYSKYDIESSFNVKGPTLYSWIKKGIIKPRIISRYGKGEHLQIFLIEDNKDFLPPKKMVESKGVTTKGDDGKEWFRTHPWYQFVDNPHEYLKGYKIMDHLRVVPPEEMKAKEEEKKKKQEERQARLELRRKNKGKKIS